MIIGMKARLAAIGAVLLMVVIGLWLGLAWRRNENLASKAEIKVESHIRTPSVAKVAPTRPKREGKKDDLTFEEFNKLLDEYFDEETKATSSTEAKVNEEPIGLATFDEVRDEETKEEEKKDENAEKLIQQIRYEQLARLLPRYEELNIEYMELQLMRDDIHNLAEMEAFHKREHEICKEWDKVQRELARLFPEACAYKPYEGPDSPGYFSMDYRKLRELVGGRLPPGTGDGAYLNELAAQINRKMKMRR